MLGNGRTRTFGRRRRLVQVFLQQRQNHVNVLLALRLHHGQAGLPPRAREKFGVLHKFLMRTKYRDAR